MNHPVLQKAEAEPNKYVKKGIRESIPIFDLIQSQPGLSTTQIVKTSGRSMGYCYPRLKILEHQQLIENKNHRWYTEEAIAAMSDKNIELASRLAALIALMPSSNFSVRYNVEGDVAYLRFDDAESAIDSELLSNNDLILRYSEPGDVVGLTLLNVSKWWKK
jgi:uncharacterized protein YuzE